MVGVGLKRLSHWPFYRGSAGVFRHLFQHVSFTITVKVLRQITNKNITNILKLLICGRTNKG